MSWGRGWERGLTNLGVSHGRSGVVVDASEVSVPVDKRRTHDEVLRHSDKGVVDSGVACKPKPQDREAEPRGMTRQLSWQFSSRAGGPVAWRSGENVRYCA